MRKRLHEQAVLRGLAAPKLDDTFYKRQIKPLFVHIYHDSDSDEDTNAAADVHNNNKQNRRQLRSKHKDAQQRTIDERAAIVQRFKNKTSSSVETQQQKQQLFEDNGGS